MANRRRNLFILLFIAGLLAASAAVISAKPIRLGLDLRGGIQLALQGRPTPQQPQVTGDAINRSIDIIRSGCDRLGVSEIEVSRVGTDQISVGIPGATSVGKATECATKPARLYFYDWEPNVIPKPRAAQGTPGSGPEAPFPSLFEAVRLASQQRPEPSCKDCTAPARYYLFQRKPPHDLIDGPETVRKDLFVAPSGKKRPHGGIVLIVPEGTIVVQKEQENNPQTGKPLPPAWFVLRDRPALSGTDITRPKQEFDPNTHTPNVTFGFTGDGRQRFQDVTRRIAQRGLANAVPGVPADQQSGHFAIVLDNQVKSRPIINYQENPDGIDGRTGAQISGSFTIGEAQDLAQFLQRGALPIDLKLISQSQVSATLGKQALNEGLRAGIAGLIVVVLFLLAFYRFLGLVASVALGVYAVLFYGLIVLIPITLTLPGIAGLILTIGVAADSNIVIFERIKEEVRAGRSMGSAIAAGYSRGIRTIVDANVVTLITAFILFVLATAGIRGFAFTLGVGTIVSLLTAVVFTQALLGTMSRAHFLRSPSMLGAARQRVHWHFDFMGASRWFFSMSGTILLVGSIALATLQLNLGIDFKSGTRVEVSLQRATDENGVRGTLNAAGLSNPEVQRIKNPGLGENAFLIQSKTLRPNKIAKLQSSLDKQYGINPNGFDSTSIGPTFGKTVANSAIKAVLFSLLVICAYVAFRFEAKFAVPVLIALFHDVLITAGVYSLTNREVTSSTVAAFLTILGYSLYDTIIVFDRIRENLPRMPRAAFAQVVNKSMSEVLTRSLATSACTLLPVLALLLFGGATLKDFAFALMVGIASGTYSSIFIASPVLTAWKEREPNFRRRRARIVDQMGYLPKFPEDNVAMKLEDEAGEPEAEEAELAPAADTAPVDSGDGRAAEPEAPLVGAGGEGARTPRSERQQRRRQQRKRRKHGRRR
jgi:SecD/SecF fusion protein